MKATKLVSLLAHTASTVTGTWRADQQAPLSDSAVDCWSEADACRFLACLVPDQVLLPRTPDYEYAELGYWSLQQTELRPACRFLPGQARDVRDALDIARFHNTSVAIVSGGHSSNNGASNIEHGITIDLSSLSEVTLSDDQDSVWLGPGARWSDVYATLEPHGLTVAGGRVGHVGVGGYVLGGGFSWFGNEDGWSCDSLLDFIVVTPDMRVLQVNSTSHDDLFWALKGSLGAFGVVVGIRMKTIQSVDFYGGAIAYDEEALPAVFAAMKELARNAETDISTSGYLSYGYLASVDDWVYNAYLINTANSNESLHIGNFRMVPNKGHTLRSLTPRESADEIARGNPPGFRRAKFTLTTAPTIEVMRTIHTAVQGFAQNMKLRGDEVLGVTYQPLTVPHLRAQSNVFQEILTGDYGPLLLVSVELWWQDDTKDESYERELRGLCEDALEFGLGWMLALHPWIYPNYAAAWQEPFVDWRIGRETRERMSAVERMYDEADVWKTLVPGVWHV